MSKKKRKGHRKLLRGFRFFIAGIVAFPVAKRKRKKLKKKWLEGSSPPGEVRDEKVAPDEQNAVRQGRIQKVHFLLVSSIRMIRI